MYIKKGQIFGIIFKQALNMKCQIWNAFQIKLFAALTFRLTFKHMQKMKKNDVYSPGLYFIVIH